MPPRETRPSRPAFPGPCRNPGASEEEELKPASESCPLPWLALQAGAPGPSPSPPADRGRPEQVALPGKQGAFPAPASGAPLAQPARNRRPPSARTPGLCGSQAGGERAACQALPDGLLGAESGVREPRRDWRREGERGVSAVPFLPGPGGGWPPGGSWTRTLFGCSQPAGCCPSEPGEPPGDGSFGGRLRIPRQLPWIPIRPRLPLASGSPNPRAPPVSPTGAIAPQAPWFGWTSVLEHQPGRDFPATLWSPGFRPAAPASCRPCLPELPSSALGRGFHAQTVPGRPPQRQSGQAAPPSTPPPPARGLQGSAWPAPNSQRASIC